MTDISLTDILASMQEDGSGLTTPLPSSWLQGRTAFGGLTSALLLEATLRACPDLPPLRSMLVNFTAPVGGTPQFISEVLRQGRNITTVSTDARDGDKILASNMPPIASVCKVGTWGAPSACLSSVAL